MSDDGKVYGRVVQVLGPVLDVEFENEAQLPEIYDALEIDEGEGEHRVSLVAEVEQEIGRDQVRCVAMSTTDGVVRGMKVLSTGKPISVPVGEECLGRVFNLLGEPVDYGPPVQAKERRPIHQPPPPLPALSTNTAIFNTPTKVADLPPPHPNARKTRRPTAAGAATRR